LPRTIEIISVRHPSYGGQREFINQIRSLYDLPKNGAEQLDFDDVFEQG
jgi:hypothetical protein